MRKQEIQSQAGGHSLPASFSQSRRSSPRQGATAFQQVFLKVKNPKVWAWGWLPPSPLHAASWLGIWIPCKRPQTSRPGQFGIGLAAAFAPEVKGWDGRLLSLMLQLDLVGLVSLLKVKNPKIWAWGWLPPSPLVMLRQAGASPARAWQASRQTLPGRGLPGRSRGLPGRGLPGRGLPGRGRSLSARAWQAGGQEPSRQGPPRQGPPGSQGLAGGGAFQAGQGPRHPERPPSQGLPQRAWRGQGLPGRGLLGRGFLGRGRQAGAFQPRPHKQGPPRQRSPRQGFPGQGLPGRGLLADDGRRRGSSGTGPGDLPKEGCHVLPEGLGYLILGAT